MRPDGEQLARITELVDAGKLAPVIDTIYPFADAMRALAHVEGGRSVGKVVIAF